LGAATIVSHSGSRPSTQPRAVHTAARLISGGRKLRLRLDKHWPWATHLAQAFQRLQAIPALT